MHELRILRKFLELMKRADSLGFFLGFSDFEFELSESKKVFRRFHSLDEIATFLNGYEHAKRGQNDAK